jgi:hypothetical protein
MNLDPATNIDPAKVMNEIYVVMAERIAWAESQAVGNIGAGDRPNYGGFDSPQDFCAAKDSGYQLLQRLLKAGAV